MMVRRTALCLGCRTALAPSERCDLCVDAEIVDLANAAGKAAVRKAAWTTVQRREVSNFFVSLLTIVFGVGGLVGVVAMTIISVKSGWGIFPAEVIGGTVLWLASWILIYWLPQRFKVLVTERVPLGAISNLEPPALEGHSGTVRGDHEVVAEAFEARQGAAVVFRDAFSRGFEVETDGTPIVVPEGRLRATLGAARGEAAAHEWARHGMSRGVAHDLVPHDGELRWCLRPGDRVRLLATLEDVLDEDVTYRKHMPPRRRAVGVVWLEPGPAPTSIMTEEDLELREKGPRHTSADR